MLAAKADGQIKIWQYFSNLDNLQLWHKTIMRNAVLKEASQPMLAINANCNNNPWASQDAVDPTAPQISIPSGCTVLPRTKPTAWQKSGIWKKNWIREMVKALLARVLLWALFLPRAILISFQVSTATHITARSEMRAAIRGRINSTLEAWWMRSSELVVVATSGSNWLSASEGLAVFVSFTALWSAMLVSRGEALEVPVHFSSLNGIFAFVCSPEK